MEIDKKGMMFVLSSPSGAGKTTLTKKLAENNSEFIISISHTTRKPRPNEVNGVDYHFVNEEKFKSLLKENAFYEHTKIFDNLYGTSKNSVNEITKKDFNVLFDIDWKGAKQLSEFKELNLIRIFILPPSKEELEKRLISRNQDDKDSIKKRLQAYSEEIQHSKDYDFVLVNDNVENCFKKIKKIISDRLK